MLHKGYNICDKVCQWHLGQVGGFFLGPPVSSTNKTDRRDIAEILLKVVLSIYQTKINQIILLSIG
jgi:hypothetical protein